MHRQAKTQRREKIQHQAKTQRLEKVLHQVNLHLRVDVHESFTPFLGKVDAAKTWKKLHFCRIVSVANSSHDETGH